MSNVNTVVIGGNLGNDAEVRHTPNGAAVTNFRIANSRKYRQGDELKTETSWIRVTAFGKLGESIAQYLTKGKNVTVVGRIKTGQYEKDGVKKDTFDIIASEIFLGPRSQNDGGGSGGGAGGNTSYDDASDSSDEVPW